MSSLIDKELENKLEKLSTEGLARFLAWGVSPKYSSGDTKYILNRYSIDHPVLMQNDAKVGTEKMVFRSCVFQQEIIIDTLSATRHITFEDCVFKKDVKINYTTLITLEISNHCHFDSLLSIKLMEDLTGFKISDITIKKELKISGDFAGLLLIKNINTNSENCEGSLEITGMNIKKLEVTHSKIKAVSILQVAFAFECLASNVTFDQLSMMHCQIQFGVNIFDSTVTNLSIDNTATSKSSLILNKVNNDNFDVLLGNYSAIYINGCNCRTLNISQNLQAGGLFQISDSIITSLNFNEVKNYGHIILSNLKEKHSQQLTIYKCDLRKTDIIACNFSMYKFDFTNSKLSELFLAETDFPKTIASKGKTNFSQAKLAFGQLHTSFQKQGDIIRAIEYQSREVEAHYNSLSFFKGRTLDKECSTKVNLWLNKLSNDFGRSWTRGVIFTLTVGVIFFSLVTIDSQPIKLAFQTLNYLLISLHISPKQFLVALKNVNFELDSRMFISFLTFLNPLRSFDLRQIFETPGTQETYIKLSNSSYIFDMIGRLFLAYGYYQTVQAFRRYGRK